MRTIYKGKFHKVVEMDFSEMLSFGCLGRYAVFDTFYNNKNTFSNLITAFSKSEEAITYIQNNE